MYIRPKTKRRLVILVLCVVAIAATVFALWRVSTGKDAARVAQLRADGMALYEAGDYARSVAKLGQYLDKGQMQEKDPEALFAYGISRKNIPLPRGKHVQEAVFIFESY